MEPPIKRDPKKAASTKPEAESIAPDPRRKELRELSYEQARKQLAPDVAKLIEKRDEGRLAAMADKTPEQLGGASWEQRWEVIHLLQCGPTGDREERGIRNLLAGASLADRKQILGRIDQNQDLAPL